MEVLGLKEYDKIGSNPSIMTIDRQVARGVLILPGFSHHIPLLTGFSSAAAQLQGGLPFIANASPFVESSVSSQKLQYRRKDICRGSFLSNQSVKKSRASEHLSVHLGVTVGNDLLGGGVSGSYDKSVLEVSDSLMISRRCSFRCGNVALSESASRPVLTLEAKQMLRSAEGLKKFQQKYGDFFVSELSIGADAGACLAISSLSHYDSIDKSIVAEAKALFWSKTVEVANDHSRHHFEQRKASLVAHDSLENAALSKSWPHGLQGDAVDEVRQQILGYSDRAESLDGRVESKLSHWAVELDRGHFDWNVCRALWEAGLVAEMVLVPFATLRELQDVLLETRR